MNFTPGTQEIRTQDMFVVQIKQPLYYAPDSSILAQSSRVPFRSSGAEANHCRNGYDSSCDK